MLSPAEIRDRPRPQSHSLLPAPLWHEALWVSLHEAPAERQTVTEVNLSLWSWRGAEAWVTPLHRGLVKSAEMAAVVNSVWLSQQWKQENKWVWPQLQFRSRSGYWSRWTISQSPKRVEGNREMLHFRLMNIQLCNALLQNDSSWWARKHCSVFLLSSPRYWHLSPNVLMARPVITHQPALIDYFKAQWEGARERAN